MAASRISGMQILRSETVRRSGRPAMRTGLDGSACARASARTESRVTPGRIMPVSGGETSSAEPSFFARTAKKFIMPASVISLSSPKSQRTCW